MHYLNILSNTQLLRPTLINQIQHMRTSCTMISIEDKLTANLANIANISSSARFGLVSVKEQMLIKIAYGPLKVGITYQAHHRRIVVSILVYILVVLKQAATRGRHSDPVYFNLTLLLFTGHDGSVPAVSLEAKCLMGPPIPALSYDTPVVDVHLYLVHNQAHFIDFN